jgi:hypothetical protein
MKSFLKFICEMPQLSNIPPKTTSNNIEERQKTWNDMLSMADSHANEFGSETLPKLEGYNVRAASGPNGTMHFVVSDDSGNHHGYLKMNHRGDHLQISSMMKNPQAQGRLHSGILHHVANHFQMPVVSDYKQTEGAMRYWNRVAAGHGGVSLRRGGEEIPYNPARMSPESIWGQGLQQQDTLLAINPKGNNS